VGVLIQDPGGSDRFPDRVLQPAIALPVASCVFLSVEPAGIEPATSALQSTVLTVTGALGGCLQYRAI
jgi:hypothetical protein